MLIVFLERWLPHHAIPSRLPFGFHMLQNRLEVLGQFFLVDFPKEVLKLKDFAHDERIVDVVLLELVNHHDHVILEIGRRGVDSSIYVIDYCVEIHCSANSL